MPHDEVRGFTLPLVDPTVVVVAEEGADPRLPHRACPSMSPIIDESHVLPLLPDPKIQTMFSGLTPPASAPSPRTGLSFNSSSARRVTPASTFRYALTPRATSTIMFFLNAGTKSLSFVTFSTTPLTKKSG